MSIVEAVGRRAGRYRFDPSIADSLIARARSAIGCCAYGLGKGGMNPRSAIPASRGKCDCSGFVAWVLGMSRMPKPTRLWWIETSAIVRDATGKQSVFVQIARPIRGCISVYADRPPQARAERSESTQSGTTDDQVKRTGLDVGGGTGGGKPGRQGHVGIVVTPSVPMLIIDCSATKNGIGERNGDRVFRRNPDTIYVVLRQWLGAID